MSKTLEDIQLRSEEVQEVLSSPPSWLIRWGIASIFLLILLILGVTGFVKYPDVVSGSIVLTTQKPPIKIVANSSGKLTGIFKHEGEMVKAKEVLAEIESPITKLGIEYLNGLVRQVDGFRADPYAPVNFSDSNYVFGSIQGQYNELKKLCLDYNKWAEDTYQKDLIRNLERKINQYRQMIEITKRQALIAQNELKHAKVKFKTDQMLFQEGVLSKLQFYNEESAFRQKQMEAENLNKSATQNRIALIELEKQLLDIKHEQQEKERNFRESISLNLHVILNQIESWQKNYLITAPISGKLTYLEPINRNQFIQAGEFIFAVIPENEVYLCIMAVPADGFGKVKIGQAVKIKFDNYPYQEYGQVNGIISKISQLANENTYRVEVKLSKGLISTYNKHLGFKPEMTGTAEIIMEDLSLLERIFYSFRKILEQ